MKSIPINTSSVAGVILVNFDGVTKMLLLKRAKEGYWCHIAGKLKKNETAVQAILREIKEETGLLIEDLFSADYMIRFYDLRKNSIFIVPVFVAFIAEKEKITLNKEHTDYKWCSIDEAKSITPFPNQHLTYDHVWSNFCQRKPSELLRVKRVKDLKKKAT